MLGFMAAAGSVMTCAGITAYKNFFFHVSWRYVRVGVILLKM